MTPREVTAESSMVMGLGIVARDPEEARKTAIQIYFRPLVVSCALADSVAVVGLVAGLIGGPPLLAFGLIGLGAVLIARLSPTPDRVFGPLEERLGISLRGDQSPT